MFIYKIINLVNEKVYVGQTVRSLDIRWKAHYKERHHGNRPIGRAIIKYGRENFRIEEICRAESKEELDRLEQFWICELKSMNPEFGYNARAGGNKTTFSEETRKKMSLAKKGKPSVKTDFSCSPETAAKIGAANKGKTPWNKGKPQSDEQKLAHSQKMKGRTAWNKGLKINLKKETER